VRILATSSFILVFALGDAVPSMHAAPVAEVVSRQPALGGGRGDWVWRSGTSTLRLTEEACPFRELAVDLEYEGIPPARAYLVDQGSRRSIGCWAPDIDGDVITREPDGLAGMIPMDWFGRDTGAW